MALAGTHSNAELCAAWFELMALPADQRDELFAVTFADAVELRYRRGRGGDVRRFIDYTFLNLITRPGDLVALCRHLATDQLRLATVEAYVHHPLTSHHVVVAMGGSSEVYRELPSSIPPHAQ